MEEETLFARGRPETIQLTETYYYERRISRNPSAKQSRPSTGRTGIIMPYDGDQYFTRQAISDVKHQLGREINAGNLEALIGYMAFANYGRTDLQKVLNLSNRYGSLPLRAPVMGNGIANMEQLHDDRHACDMGFSYTPQGPDTIPVNIDLSLLDEEILSLPSMELASEEGRRHLGDVATQIAQQVSFRRSLLISSQVRVDLPHGAMRGGETPKIIRMGLGWPTITSFRGVRLLIAEQPGKPARKVPIIFNPLTRSLEWNNITMRLGPTSAGANMQSYLTEEMHLLVDYPGELYHQPNLDGRVEVEIPGYLLSGVQVRLFDGAGERAKKIDPKVTTKIINQFQLVLDEAFAKRTLSPYQHLHFAEVIPDEMRIADIKTALGDLGFRISKDESLPGRKELRHFILAERSDGPDIMRLWLFIEGKHYETERVIQLPGGQSYKSTFDSGDIEVYVRGEMPGNSRRLIQEMNAFQGALRTRFERLRSIR